MIQGQCDRVQQIIEESEKDLKLIEVSRDVSKDIGNLLVIDNTEIIKEKLKDDKEDYIKEICRDGVQTIINSVWDLPIKTIDNYEYVTLPEPTLILPREKKAPKQRPQTRWEKFAQEKNIKKKKRDKKIWDEELQKFVPRYGYLKNQAEKEKNWLIEVPNNVDPYTDMYAKKKEEKKERIAKNEYQRLQNLKKILPKKNKNTQDLKNDELTARLSTASVGRFQPRIAGEQDLTEVLSKKGKRKRSETPMSRKALKTEKEESIKVLSNIDKKELNVEVAVKKQIAKENYETKTKRSKKGDKTGRRSKQGKRHRTKSEFKAITKGILPNAAKKTPRHIRLQKRKNNRDKTRSKGRQKKGSRKN